MSTHGKLVWRAVPILGDSEPHPLIEVVNDYLRAEKTLAKFVIGKAVLINRSDSYPSLSNSNQATLLPSKLKTGL